MKNDVQAISLNFRCSKSYLSLNDKVTFYLDIVNNLNIKLENIIIKNFFDNDCLKVIQNLFNCNDERKSIIKIDKLDPFEHTRIEYCLLLYDVPKELKMSVFSKIFYNGDLNGQFIKEEIETNTINIKVYNIKIQDFNIVADKNCYRIGDTIKYTLKISNSGNVVAQNVIIKNFIPKDTCFLDESIKFTGDAELFYLDDGLLLSKINENSTITINFNVKINSNIKSDSIKHKAFLEYKEHTKNNSDTSINKIESNEIELSINSGSVFSEDGTFVHEIDKEIAYLNDIISHKITIKNENKITIKNAYFKDEKNENLEYVKNTLTINGIPRNYENIYESVFLNDENFEEIIITYKTKIVDIPKDGKLNLNSKIYYKLDTEYESEREFNDSCQENNFFIYGAIIKTTGFNRFQNNEVVSIGEIVDCVIEIKNDGNLDARNLILKENIIDEMNLVEGSIFINSEKVEKIDLKEELCFKYLKSNEKLNLKYKLKANDFTRKNENLISHLKYECLLLNGNLIKMDSVSNSCKTKIEGANITLNKIVDKSLCKVNDILTFNICLKNKGNLEALDIKIKDEKNEHLEFIKNSLYLNNFLLENQNIYDGIWKDILDIDEEINISYKTKIKSLPKSSITFSKTNLKYIHLIDDKKYPKNAFNESDNIKIVVVNPNIVLKDISCIGCNTIKYSINDNPISFKILIKNDGNMFIEELEFLESIPKELEFVKGSFMINDTSLDDFYFYDGFKIKNLDCQEYREISFLLKPTNVENLKEALRVKSNLKYKFVNSLNNILQEETTSFEEDIFIIKPNLKVLKEVNKTVLAEGEELTETLTVSNMGNFEIEDIKIILPKYNNLIPVKDTLSIDNSIIDEFPSDNKISIGNINKNETKKLSVRYEILNSHLNNIHLESSKVVGKVKIKDNNISNNMSILSNSLNIFPIKNSIILEQNLSNKSVLAGDNIRYFLSIKNTGNTIYRNAILNISIPDYLIYTENTLSINNELRNDIKNFTDLKLGDIKINETIKIAISFNINSNAESNVLELNAKINGECFLLNKYSDYKEFKSDILKLKVDKCLINIYRSSDITSANVGDRITISSIISNEGSLDLKDIMFYEEENSFLSFVENSLKISNEPVILTDSIYNGIMLGEIKKGTSVTVKCEYEYINGGFSGIIETYSSIDFSRINPSSLNFERFSIKSNHLNIEKAMSLFKNININGEIEINENDPDILEVSNLIINPSILSYYPIQTIRNKSYDNQILTGKKIIVEGFIDEKIEYIVNDNLSALYFIEKLTPFSTFIVMPEGNEYDNIVLECKVEDVYFKSTNSRKIFRDINFVIEGY